MQLTFLGATKTVTGSKYLIEYQDKKILIDCGLFQGLKELRLLNWEPLSINPKNIDAIILTHAHIDHSGYIPRLVKDGFRGKIYCSEATFDLCKILLPDSGYLQEEDAKAANRYGYSRHKIALPLYNKEEAEESLQYFQIVEFGKAFHILEDFHFTLSRSGHILGSSFINLFVGSKNIVFSGDLGRLNDPIMCTPAKIESADYLFIESTYGDLLHSTESPLKQIADVVNKTCERGGMLIIPAFAVGRVQSVLYYLYCLKRDKKIPNLPVFLDSPMSISASNLLCKHLNEHRLGKDLCGLVCEVAKYVHDVEESKSLDKLDVPSIIISASGMATGGRILHHLKHYISDHKNTVLFVGYQAAGTRGAKLVNGDKEIKIHGENYLVKAEIVNLDNISAHGDYEEILTWLSNFKKPPKKTFIVHGDLKSATSLQEKIITRLGWKTNIPEYLQRENL
jgi:metallo-beta-lactamase family protein